LLNNEFIGKLRVSKRQFPGDAQTPQEGSNSSLYFCNGMPAQPASFVHTRLQLRPAAVCTSNRWVRRHQALLGCRLFKDLVNAPSTVAF
jgi:hypothetical protein